MSVFLSIVGLIIGVSAFLYFLSMYDAGKAKIKQLTQSKAPQQNLSPDEVTYNNPATRAPGERICPVCTSKLSRYEALYATLVDDEAKKILIYGCRYCYKENEDPETKKQSAL